MKGAEAVIHGAAVYEVGIPKSERAAMYEANVVGTETVLRAALEEKVAAGRLHLDRRRRSATPTARSSTRPTSTRGTDFTSYYEETKYRGAPGRQEADRRGGLPCVIVQPGGVYGPETTRRSATRSTSSSPASCRCSPSPTSA